MKKHQFILLTILATAILHAQPSIQWQKCLGGTSGDWAQSIEPTNDSGYIVAGYTLSNNNDVSGNNGNEDFWATKLNSAGNLQWQTCLGGSGFEEAYCVQQTADSGFVIAGFTTSNDSDVNGFHGGEDYWVVKLNHAGNIQWQTCLGGTGFDGAFSIVQSTDGGFVVAGAADSNDGDVSGNHGAYDAWIVKLDANGAIVWQKCIGGSADEIASSVQQTNDGGYIVAGSTMSNDGDVSGNHGNWDYWVVKLDSAGNVQWQQCYGGSAQDIGYSIAAATDSGFYITGFTLSTNGDVSGLHGSQPDFWLIRISNNGALQWQKCFGGTGDEKAYSVHATSDTGCIVAGYARSNDGDVSGNHNTATQDYWIVKVNAQGNLQWQKCLGGASNDWARSVHATPDTGYVVAGFTASTNGDVTGNHGNNDCWIVKLRESAVGMEEYNQISFELFPNPADEMITIHCNPSDESTVLCITNALGEVVYKTAIISERTMIDVSQYATGVYVVTIHDAAGQRTEKMIVR